MFCSSESDVHAVIETDSAWSLLGQLRDLSSVARLCLLHGCLATLPPDTLTQQYRSETSLITDALPLTLLHIAKRWYSKRAIKRSEKNNNEKDH